MDQGLCTVSVFSYFSCATSIPVTPPPQLPRPCAELTVESPVPEADSCSLTVLLALSHGVTPHI